MKDLYTFLKQLSDNAYNGREFLLAYALDGWLETGHSSTTEAMGELELLLKQYKNGTNAVVNQQVEECLRFVNEWFHK